MSALDDAYSAAAVALSRTWERKPHEESFEEQARDAIGIFLTHLADNPPDEMVEAVIRALWRSPEPDAEIPGLEGYVYHLPMEDPWWREWGRRAFVAALRSITTEKAEA